MSKATRLWKGIRQGHQRQCNNFLAHVQIHARARSAPLELRHSRNPRTTILSSRRLFSSTMKDVRQ